MTKIFKITMAFLVLLTWVSCNTSKKGSGYIGLNVEARKSELQIIMQPPINTADKAELAKNVYNDKVYFLLQDKKNQFKDNAPFVEILDGGTRERLWFTSSRADERYKQAAPTNLYQQIYYCERELGAGQFPKEGWSEPKLFELNTDNPMLVEFISAFNRAVKGAVAIAGTTMIISCDQLNNSIYNEFKNLWSIDYQNGVFANPMPLMALSNEKTWESHPALSANGRHLFFTSNRLVNANDLSFVNDQIGDNINLFYSFKENDGTWRAPILVGELYSQSDDLTPQLNQKGNKLYFSSDRNGKFEIFEAEIELKENGGYVIEKSSVKPFDKVLIDYSAPTKDFFTINGTHNYKYPFLYDNPLNIKATQALFWASDHADGFGSYDIYACAMPYLVDYNVVLRDLSAADKHAAIIDPVISIEGAERQMINAGNAKFSLYSGLPYQVSGGSNAKVETGTYHCDYDEQYIFVGYSKVLDKFNPANKSLHVEVIHGAAVRSDLTDRNAELPVFNVQSDTVIFDTIYITKAWVPKPPCPGVLEIPQKHAAIPYFQTGFWEVNTSANLKRDLTLLHDGYHVNPDNDIYNPAGAIEARRSGYRAFEWETPIPAIDMNDKRTYSIADARWVELHPLNYNWGDRPGFGSNVAGRMQGRKDRIAQYVDYAKKVDENLQILADTISEKYIGFLDLHKSAKPRLLIEIFAVSDQREVLRGWYIGDTVEYRSSRYLGQNNFSNEPVVIVPPKVNESTKTLTEIKACAVELNSDGNNGSMLGISESKTEINTNLSRLRAWYGYHEMFKKLLENENFVKYLDAGKVALPDNNIDYNDAEIIIITHGRRIDIIDPKNPYPVLNNPNGQGFYDYDQIRRVEVRMRLLMENQPEMVKDFCCFGSDKK